MNKKRIIYFCLLFMCILFISITYFSYAFLTSKKEVHGKLNIVAGTLDYKIESSDLKDSTIIIDKNSTKKINIKITSLNTIDSKYELYYETEDSNNLIIGYGEDSRNTYSGIINANGSVEVEVILKNESDISKTITFKVEGGLIINELVLNNNAKKLIDYCNLSTTYTFDYTGDSQEFTILCSGKYKVELWGASGGGSRCHGSFCYTGGLGSYTSGTMIIEKALNKLYLFVGGQGSDAIVGIDSAGGYNGGGIGTWDGKDDEAAGGGGGATDIRLANGAWNNFNSLKNRIMVAAGSAGGLYNIQTTVHYGGGLEANLKNQNIIYNDNTLALMTENTTQTTGYKFGIGQDGIGVGDSDGTPGAGSGYYGGFSYNAKYINISGGGSSFISGHNGCDAIKEESTEDNIIHTGNSIHYSGLYFDETVMIDGAGYNWTTEKGDYVGMPTHDGTGIMTGNKGNGYAKITYIAN